MEQKELMSVKTETFREQLKVLHTQSGIPVQKVYTPDDIADFDYNQDSGDPGEYPYTRGPYPDMYRNRLMYLQFASWCLTPQETNERLKVLIPLGQTAIMFSSDQTTMLGIDPDHPLSVHDAAMTGQSFFALCEMEDALDGISCVGSEIEFRSAIPVSCSAQFAQLMALAEKRGEDTSKIQGMMQNDILGHSSHGCLGMVQPFDISLRLCLDLVEFCAKNMPMFHPISPCGYDIRESGIDSFQEVGVILAAGIAYSEALIKERGLKFDDFAPKMSFSLSSEVDFFETIAKARAARRMWAKIATEKFNAQDPRSARMRCSLRPAGSSLIAQRPINNIARLTLECLAATLAGCQGLDMPGYDEALSTPPTEEARMINLDTAHIIIDEAGAALTADPLGGSYYMEWLTNRLDDEANKYIEKIEDQGGMIEACRKGWLAKEVIEGQRKRAEEINKGEKLIVGMNEYRDQEEKGLPIIISEHQPEIAVDTVARVRRFKQERDLKKTRETLENLGRATKNNENLIRPLIECYKCNATVGEVTGTIREAFGYPYDVFNLIEKPDFLK